jgi:hypothetical protein
MKKVISAALLLLAAPAFAQLPPPGMPAKPFGELPSPPAPDYANPAHWAALPDRADAADLVPEGDAFGDRQASAKVDVFYIHPTTYRGKEFWNQALDDAATNKWTDDSVIARQASVFNACCRVFAPRYRQASAASLMAPPAMNGMQAHEFAWLDVRAAFLHYMKHWNKGRPFIIAGHSQGAAHTERWLNEFAKDRKLRAQLVAAYPIGITFPRGVVSRSFNGVPVCREPRDTGCFVSWNAFDPDSDGAQMVAFAQKRYLAKYGDNPETEVVCVNPLTFSLARSAVPASANLGALPATRADGSLPPTEAGILGAACVNGIARISLLPATGYAIVKLPGGSLHFNDFDLFYQNIRLNAVARTDAWMARGHGKN